MHLLLASDIFGVTAPFLVIVDHLAALGWEVSVLSSFADARVFEAEDEAYAAFLQCGGVDAYAERLGSIMAELPGPLICIGFSAGAAALWQVLASPAAGKVQSAICFYGSQIRQAVECVPRCETLLVFPEEEAHFSVPDLLKQLQGRPRIECCTVPWRHGYLNRLSRNFDSEGYQRTLAWLKGLLDQPDRIGVGEEVFRPLLNKGS